LGTIRSINPSFLAMVCPEFALVNIYPAKSASFDSPSSPNKLSDIPGFPSSDFGATQYTYPANAG
jgi:hypothetical protein